MDVEILVAIVAGVFSLSAVLISRYWDNQKTREANFRDKKIPVYESFLEFIFEVALSSSKEPLEDKTFPYFTQKLITWGSDEVLLNYIIWRNGIGTFTADEFVSSLSRLLTAIRRDLGNKGLSNEMMEIFVNLAIRGEAHTKPSMESQKGSDDDK
jgi:hypothetical protein